VTYGNGRFVAVGKSGINAIAVNSADGVEWAQYYLGINKNLSGIAYGGDQFIAVGGTGYPNASAALFTSTNGGNWVERQPGATNTLLAITYGHGLFVAVGGNYTATGFECALVTSGDGLNWVQRQTGLTNTILNGVAYGGGRFVAVGPSDIITSVDGMTWTVVSPPSGLYWPYLLSVAYGNGQFVAVGAGPLLSSPDGLNWSPHEGNTDGFLSSVTYGDGHFLVVGGGILESGSIIGLALVPRPEAGLINLSLTGPTGLRYTIQSSSDLISWQDLTNITTTLPTITFPIPSTSTPRLYRAYAQ
jgi:hypothetical protein